jgi:hypothetical protein
MLDTLLKRYVAVVVLALIAVDHAQRHPDDDRRQHTLSL